MTRLLRYRWQIRCAICLVNVVHVCVHGTPLDGGALDAALYQLDATYLAMETT